ISEQNGGNISENFTAVASGNRVRFDRVDPAPFFVDIGTTEHLVINANGGDDTFTAGNGLATLIQIVVDGRAGNAKRLRGRTAHTPCAAAMATTSWTPTPAALRCSPARATTPSSGIRATAATPSRARTAAIRWSSTTPTRQKPSISRPMAAACG